MLFSYRAVHVELTVVNQRNDVIGDVILDGGDVDVDPQTGVLWPAPPATAARLPGWFCVNHWLQTKKKDHIIYLIIGPISCGRALSCKGFDPPVWWIDPAWQMHLQFGLFSIQTGGPQLVHQRLCGMWCPVCGKVHVKDPLLLNQKSSLCGLSHRQDCTHHSIWWTCCGPLVWWHNQVSKAKIPDTCYAAYSIWMRMEMKKVGEYNFGSRLVT